jgi:membrane protease YdiL (CAAX protease family)
MNRARAEGVIIVLATCALVRAFWLASSSAGRVFDSLVLEGLTKLLLWVGGSLLVASWLAPRHGAPVSSGLGITADAGRGLAFALMCTLPMAAALAFVPLGGFDADRVLGAGVIGPIAEEILFRGFLLGLLLRWAGWSVGWAIAISSMLFGLAHLSDADGTIVRILRGPETASFVFLPSEGTVVHYTPAELVWWQFVQAKVPILAGTAAPLAAGGAVLAWIAYRWQSLWPAIGLHACMNIWWALTRGEHARPALGPDLMSAAQLFSLILAIIVTERSVRRAGLDSPRNLHPIASN